MKLSFYYAIEPLGQQRAELEKNINSWGETPHEINPDYFTPEFTTEHKFDLVMMSHSLYCMKEWKKILEYVHNFLAQGGKVRFDHF